MFVHTHIKRSGMGWGRREKEITKFPYYLRIAIKPHLRLEDRSLQSTVSSLVRLPLQPAFLRYIITKIPLSIIQPRTLTCAVPGCLQLSQPPSLSSDPGRKFSVSVPTRLDSASLCSRAPAYPFRQTAPFPNLYRK